MIRGAALIANAGDECDAPDDLAAALIANGLAAAVLPAVDPIETATVEAPENAMQPRPTPRRSRRAEE